MESNWRFNVSQLGFSGLGPTLAARVNTLEDWYLLNWSPVATDEWMLIRLLPGEAWYEVLNYFARGGATRFPGFWNVLPDSP